jgi:chromosome segregation ATPase
MEEQIKELRSRVYDGEIIEEKLREELASIKRNANHDSDENMNLRDRINELNRKIDESGRLLSEKDDQLDKKQNEIASLKRQLGTQLDTTDQIKSSEQRQQETIRDLELKLSKAKLEGDKSEYRIQDLNDKVTDLYREIDRANDEAQSLSVELRKKANDNEDLREEVRSLNRALTDLEKRENVLVMDLERKSHEISHLKQLMSNGVQLPQEYYASVNASKERMRSYRPVTSNVDRYERKANENYQRRREHMSRSSRSPPKRSRSPRDRDSDYQYRPRGAENKYDSLSSSYGPGGISQAKHNERVDPHVAFILFSSKFYDLLFAIVDEGECQPEIANKLQGRRS